MSKDDDGNEIVDVAALNETLKTLAEGQKNLANLPQVLNQIGQGLVAINTKLEAGTDGGQKLTAREPDPVDPMIVNDMDNSQLTDHILQGVKGIIIETVKPISERVDNASTDAATAATKTMIIDAASNHKDFWEYKNEMMGLAKAHSTLEPEELYDLAKSKNPDKVADLAAKDSEGEDGKGNDPDNVGTEPPFGGLTPTSSVETKEEKSDKSFKSASLEAWDEVVKDSAVTVGNA